MEFTQDFVRVLHMTEVRVHLSCPQSRGVCNSVGQTIGCVVGDLGCNSCSIQQNLKNNVFLTDILEFFNPLTLAASSGA